ncbi:2',5'-phosphodiesterase 12-like [Rhynchophorus ferrugineus]|uniref:2',5'-phosphodiesterase 12-like n=1 Tax=Rhynchophorus ferrugineus TaxID=354439 RepID=UPI003FCD58D1
MGEPGKIAYIRRFSNAKCDFRFFLSLKNKHDEKISREIIVAASVTESLAFLIDVIKKNVAECLENNKENTQDDDKALLSGSQLSEDILVHFVRDSKFCRGDILIMEFINLTKNGYRTFLQILDDYYRVVADAPLVRHLELPSVILANYPVEPSKFHTSLCKKNYSKFNWYRSLDKEKWELVGNSLQYSVKEEDVGYYLKLSCTLYGENNIKGPYVEVVSEYKVEKMIEFPVCPFETRHKLTHNHLHGFSFRVVSYNILSDRYATRLQYNYCPLRALNIHYRKQLVMKELRGYNADIIALQEVDNQHFTSYFKNEFNEMGFKSLYHRKGNCIPEGLLCAFNRRRYRLLESMHIVFKLELERRKVFAGAFGWLSQNAELIRELKTQNTSLQVTVLCDNTTKDVIIVGNTHLYYHPDADHIRLLQSFMSTTILNSIKSRLTREYMNVGVVFCGDFNSNSEKSLYRFMIDGTIDPKHRDCLTISPTGHASIYHNFILESASGLPKYTNYTLDFKDCLDYIFVERNKFSVLRNVPVTGPEVLEQYAGLPNEFFPSDHLALVVDLQTK